MRTIEWTLRSGHGAQDGPHTPPSSVRLRHGSAGARPVRTAGDRPPGAEPGPRRHAPEAQHRAMKRRGESHRPAIPRRRTHSHGHERARCPRSRLSAPASSARTRCARCARDRQAAVRDERRGRGTLRVAGELDRANAVRPDHLADVQHVERDRGGRGEEAAHDQQHALGERDLAIVQDTYETGERRRRPPDEPEPSTALATMMVGRATRPASSTAAAATPTCRRENRFAMSSARRRCSARAGADATAAVQHHGLPPSSNAASAFSSSAIVW